MLSVRAGRTSKHSLSSQRSKSNVFGKDSMQQNIQTFIGIGCAPFLIPFKCSTKCLYRNTLAAFQNVPASEETAKKLITNFLPIPLSHLSRNPRLRRSTIKEDIVVIWMAQAQLRTVISTKQNKL